ncbi:MAG: iron-sulfur cluster assembly scaffold protein [Deltaproteobacteria bacterium]|nr:iron-sulfur cluster assembly scaffold protein [Deltaproteobacteria bacterium]
MDQSSMEFWQQHSSRFLKMVFQSDKRESLQHPDGYGKATRECGDTIEIFLIIRHGAIRSASFQSHGCIYSIACANALVSLVEGKTLEEALQITPDAIIDYLETLPKEESHCAILAVRALHAALMDTREVERQPWKKFYPRKER